VAEQERGSDDPQLAAIARHALHDEELIAAFAAGDIENAGDAEKGRALVERCAFCRDLHQDLTAISSAIRASGTAAQRAQTRAAPRDFRLTAQDAARLRPGSPIARVAPRLGWRARLGLGVAALGRPAGAALATFGIVGLLIGSLTLGGSPLGSTIGAAGASAAPGIDSLGSPPESTADGYSYGPLSSAKNSGAEGGPPAARDGGGAAGSLILFGGSLALLAVGIALILASRRTLGSISTPRGN
jgi:hypothetical protein